MLSVHELTEMPRVDPLGWTVSRTAPEFAVHTLMEMPRALDSVLSTSSCLTEESQRWTGNRTQLVEFYEAEFSPQL